MKAAAKATYGKKGDKIVQMNYDAIDAGATGVVKIEVPANWKDAQDESFAKVATGNRKDVVDFVNDIQIPVNGQEGNKIPVSVVKKYENGQTPSGSAAYEKRGIAVDVPVWNPENCIQIGRAHV